MVYCIHFILANCVAKTFNSDLTSAISDFSSFFTSAISDLTSAISAFVATLSSRSPSCSFGTNFATNTSACFSGTPEATKSFTIAWVSKVIIKTNYYLKLIRKLYSSKIHMSIGKIYFS